MPGSSSDSGPIPPSQPSSGADRSAPPPRGSAIPLLLAVVAAATCWNIFGAPFALVTAATGLALALRPGTAPRRARGRRLAAAIAGVALGVAALVLLNAIRGSGPGAAVPGAPTSAQAEATRALDDAERQTAARREAARRQLEGQGSAGEKNAGPSR